MILRTLELARLIRLVVYVRGGGEEENSRIFPLRLRELKTKRTKKKSNEWSSDTCARSIGRSSQVKSRHFFVSRSFVLFVLGDPAR